MIKIAVYGKGGIGKSTMTSNLAAAFAYMGKRVIQIGCDPKADSTINLLGGQPLQPVMDYLREKDEEPESIDQIAREGYGGVLCIETGGPTPGLGCAGRGICTAVRNFEDRSYARVEGIILNSRNVEDENRKVEEFAQSKGLPIVARIPRSDDIIRFEDQGKTVIEGDPELYVSRCYLDLANKLLEEEKTGN